MVSALSLFSGAGGMDLGVRQAGFEILACVEIDPHCCQTLQSAIDKEALKTILLEQDIREIKPYHLMKDLGLKSGELDLLFGGSPCQSFSQAGKRGSLEDERGLLLFEFIRFARAFQPKVIFIEQVKGILTAPDKSGIVGGVCQALKTQLQELGYTLKRETINAANYGVAQIRERVFIVATKVVKSFEFPAPTHGK